MTLALVVLVKNIKNVVCGKHIAKQKSMSEQTKTNNGFLGFLGKLIFTLFLISCAILMAGALIISYPKFNISYAVWFAFIPFTYIITRVKRDSSALTFGWLIGFLFYFGFLYWIIPTCQMGGLSKELSYLSLFLLSFVLSIKFAIFAVISKHLTKLGKFFPLFCAFAWVGLEWIDVLCSYLFTGFPWFLLGYSQWQNLSIMQISSITGVFGVSFIIVLVSVSIGYLFTPNKENSGKAPVLLGSLLLLGLLHINGSQIVSKTEKKEITGENTKIKIALIQPNINQYTKWDPGQVAFIKKTLKDMSEKAVIEYQPDLVVWPESSIPGYINTPELKDWVSLVAKQNNTPFLIGAMQKQKTIEGEKDYFQHVSAHLISNTGVILQDYHKQVLVPFGEYVPLKDSLIKWFPSIDVIGFLGGFTAGLKDQQPFTVKGVKFGPSICFEGLFPQVFRDFENKGAQFFINITNDSWYLDTAAPYQHFTTSVFRAVETARPILRLSNNGVSGTISRTGRVQKSTLLNKQEILLVELTIPKEEEQTIYSNVGDIFALICLLLFVLGLFLVLVFNKD
jgi:apolipoprotein N-acyltransferase